MPAQDVHVDTRELVTTTNLPGNLPYIQTAGFWVAGDGGGALYKRVPVEPSHPGKVQSADGAWWELSSWQVSVRMFGAKGDGSTDDTVAFKAVRDYFQRNDDYRGGRIYIPKGVYQLTDEIVFTQYSQGQVHNITLLGDGPQATVLSFAGCPAGKDGIRFGSGSHYSVEDLTISFASRDGLSLDGGVPGSPEGAQQIRIKNVRVQFSGRHNIFSSNIFMARLQDIWSNGAGDCGFLFAGFHTSVEVERCWASNCAGAGWSINGMVYSNFLSCGADNNLFGYALSNLNGVHFTGCGAESNRSDGWLAFSSAASTIGIPNAAHGIHGVTLTSCFGYLNGLAESGNFANLLAVRTADNIPIEITVISCTTTKDQPNDPSMVVNGESGRALVIEAGKCEFDGGIYQFGNCIYEGRKFKFTPALIGSTTAGEATYVFRDASYLIREGELFYDINIIWSSHTGSGWAEIAPLPKPAISAAIGTLFVGGLHFTGAPCVTIEAGTETVHCAQSNSGAPVSYISLTSQGSLAASGRYAVR